MTPELWLILAVFLAGVLLVAHIQDGDDEDGDEVGDEVVETYKYGNDNDSDDDDDDRRTTDLSEACLLSYAAAAPPAGQEPPYSATACAGARIRTKAGCFEAANNVWTATKDCVHVKAAMQHTKYLGKQQRKAAKAQLRLIRRKGKPIAPQVMTPTATALVTPAAAV